MLLGPQSRGFVATDHYGVVSEQLRSADRKSLDELRSRVDTLAVILVRRSAHHTGYTQRAIAFRRPSHELVFPSRLAFHVQNAASSCWYVDDARARVVDDIALAFELIEHEPQLVRARLAGGKVDGQARRRAIARKLDVARSNQRLAIVDAQPRGSGAFVTNPNLRSHRRADGRARRHVEPLELQITGDLLGPDADGVNRYAVRGDLRQPFFAE